jgi:hypothetical protein
MHLGSARRRLVLPELRSSMCPNLVVAGDCGPMVLTMRAGAQFDNRASFEQVVRDSEQRMTLIFRSLR